MQAQRRGTWHVLVEQVTVLRAVVHVDPRETTDLAMLAHCESERMREVTRKALLPTQRAFRVDLRIEILVGQDASIRLLPTGRVQRCKRWRVN